MEKMTRGDVAECAGVSRETVRYYEKRELIPKPSRTAAGYRQYTGKYVERIRFVKRAQELGFTLKEIKELLSLRADPEMNSSQVKQQAKAKVAEVEKKIRDLRRIKEALTSLIASCGGNQPTANCPIMEAMRDDEAFQEVVR